jgi:hypothetical protein
MLFADIDTPYETTLPFNLPSLGVKGYTTRHDAASLLGYTSPASMPRWPDDLNPDLAMTVQAGAVSPLYYRENGIPSIRFDGTLNTGLTKAVTSGAYKTFVMLCRVKAASGAATVCLFGGGVVINRTTGNSLTVTFADSGQTANAGNFASDVWKVVILVVNGGASSLSQGANALTASPTISAGQSTLDRVRFGLEGSSRGTLDIASWAAYPDALDASQREAVRAAYKTAFPALIV